MAFKKGNVPWNKGKKGVMPTPWNKGLTKNDPKVAKACHKMSQTKKILYSAGKLTVWNKGKNKFIDKRLAQQGNAASKTKKIKFAAGKVIIWNKGKKNMQIPWNKGRVGLQKAWNKGLNKEISCAIHKQAASLVGSWNVKYGKEHAENRKAKIRAARLKQSFDKVSSIEHKTKKVLLKLGCQEKQTLNECNKWLDFACQQSIEGTCVPDFVFPLQSLVINCDGDYWHGNTKLFKKLNSMQKERKYKDKTQDKSLEEKGWLVLRFWEHFIKDNEERYARILANALEIQLTL